jgi:hypothetical protein
MRDGRIRHQREDRQVLRLQNRIIGMGNGVEELPSLEGLEGDGGHADLLGQW